MWKDPSGTNMEVSRVDLANWAFRISPKFSTGIKYQFYQGFWPDQRSGNPNYSSPCYLLFAFITWVVYGPQKSIFIIIIIIIISVLPVGRSFTANSGTYAAILPKGKSSISNSGTWVAVLPGMNRCGSFPLLLHPTLSLASEQTLKDLKRS